MTLPGSTHDSQCPLTHRIAKNGAVKHLHQINHTIRHNHDAINLSRIRREWETSSRLLSEHDCLWRT